jgi:hypothetical protein
MDMKALLEPYVENGRTLEGQMKWLLSKGIPQNSADQAMLYIYDELDRGKKHENGFELDRALLEKALDLHRNELINNVQKLEDFFNDFAKRRTIWQRIKAVFGK